MFRVLFQAFALVVLVACACSKRSSSASGSAAEVGSAAAPVTTVNASADAAQAGSSDAAVAGAVAADVSGVYNVSAYAAVSVVAGPTRTLLYYEDQWRDDGFTCECVSEVTRVGADRYQLTPLDGRGVEGTITIQNGKLSSDGLLDAPECCAPGWPGMHTYSGAREPLSRCKARPQGAQEVGWTAGDEVEAAVSRTDTTVARFRRGGEVQVEKVRTEWLDCPKRSRGAK